MTTPLTKYLAEQKALCDGATAGPWTASDGWNEGQSTASTVEASEPEIVRKGQSKIWPDGIRKKRIAECEEGESPKQDAEFIAASRQTIPKLLSMLAVAVAESAGELEWEKQRSKCLYGEVRRFKREFGEIYKLLAALGIDPPRPARPLKAIKMLHAKLTETHRVLGECREALEGLMNYRDDGEGREYQVAMDSGDKALASAKGILDGPKDVLAPKSDEAPLGTDADRQS